LADVPATDVWSDANIALAKPYVTPNTITPRDFWPGSTTVLAVIASAPAWR